MQTRYVTDFVRLSFFFCTIKNPVVNPGGVLNFELGTDVRPEISTTTL